MPSRALRARRRRARKPVYRRIDERSFGHEAPSGDLQLAAEVEALLEKRECLRLGEFIRLVLIDEHFDLLAEQRTKRRSATHRENFALRMVSSFKLTVRFCLT